ncbi:MAG: hypothetical protein WD851_21725 [Pirellulales bacterium]
MYRSTRSICGALCFIALLIDVAPAQISDLYRMPDRIEGNAGVELSSQRRRDIGTGYSGSQLNQQSLSRASVSTPFVGGYTGRTIVGGINNDSSGGMVSRPAASFGGGSSAPASKPFSGASTRPTVSPYLNLFREDLEGFSDFNYQTLVRPQLQQQEINQNLQRQQQEINIKVQSLSARQAFTPQGSQSQMPTGHQTTFRNLSHYYPLAGQPRRGK